MLAAGTRFLTPEQHGARFASTLLPAALAAGSYHVHPALGDSTIHAAAIPLSDPDHGLGSTRVPVSMDAFAAQAGPDGQRQPGGRGHAVSRTAAMRGNGSGVSDMSWVAACGCGGFSISGLASKAMPAPSGTLRVDHRCYVAAAQA